MTTASGIGLATIAGNGTVLDVWFPQPTLSPLANGAKPELSHLQGDDDDRKVSRKIIELEIDITKIGRAHV